MMVRGHIGITVGIHSLIFLLESPGDWERQGVAEEDEEPQVLSGVRV